MKSGSGNGKSRRGNQILEDEDGNGQIEEGRGSNELGLEAYVEATADFLNKAVKTVIVGWLKLREAKAQQAFMEFAEASGFPISVMPSSKGLVPEHHPHFIVTYWGAVSSSFCREIVESADTCVFVGPIFNDYSSVGYSLLIKKEKAVIGQPNCVTIGNGPSLGWVSWLNFRARSGGSDVAFEYVKQIHAMIILHGFGSSTRVCNPIIDLCAKNGFIDSARKVFDLLCFKDSASWVAMISGLSQNGYEQEAILLFCQMHISGIMPTPYVLTSALNACTKIELFEVLIDMYAKLGKLSNAQGILRRFTQDDIVSWTAMVPGNVQHNMFTEALKTFGEMQNRGIQSDNIGFSIAISAAGFDKADNVDITPTKNHKICDQVGETVWVEEDTAQKTRLDKDRMLVNVLCCNKVDYEVTVYVGNLSTPMTLKEDPAPVSSSWIVKYLGLKTEPKMLNLVQGMVRVDLPFKKAGRKFSPLDGCQSRYDSRIELKDCDATIKGRSEK
ncbi:hypothetical protein Dsin_021461 [Dipteronia sinensis]|uniref:pyruvate decarboxylase n=1 Tax=Dipteronia sinensis TaxID=43782 RepID=A0AAE0A115_9ROSI|nr:hypothetical protein Dsin_021461 [Dipteronia sinensis]